MSDAKWCDIGGHAFPAGQQGSEVLTKQRNDKDAHGRTFLVTESLDVCRDCNPMIARKDSDAPKALEADRFPGEDADDSPLPIFDGAVVHRRNVIRPGNWSVCGLNSESLTFSTEQQGVTCEPCRAFMSPTVRP